MKNNNTDTFNIVFNGIEYIVDVVVWRDKTTIYVEYANQLLDDDVPENDLLKLTEYLISEGFVIYDE